MALRQIRVGSLKNVHQYDDGDYNKSMEVEDPISCTATPVTSNDLVRLVDMGQLYPVEVADIDNPTELASVAGSNGVIVLAYKVVGSAELNEYTIYVYDSSGPALNSPYIVDAAGTADERWIAIGGKYRIFTTMNALATKNPPIDADKVIYRDSAAAIVDSLVTSTWTQVKAFINTIGTVEDWRYAAPIADDETKALPTILADYAAKVEVIISSDGNIDANATFMIDSTGTVTSQIDSGNCVYNVDTDAKLCIGTAAAQNPLIIKYRLGSAVAKIMITMMYVKA